MRKILVIILFLSLLLVSVAYISHAATNGKLGASSTGSMKISVIVLPRVSVQHLQDLALNLAEHNQLTSTETTTSACVYGGSRGGGYYLIAEPSSVTEQRYMLRNKVRTLQNKNYLPAFHIKGRHDSHSLSYHLSAKDYNDPTFRTIIPSQPIYLNGATTLTCKDKTNLDIRMQLDKEAHPISGEQYYDHVNVVIAPQ